MNQENKKDLTEESIDKLKCDFVNDLLNIKFEIDGLLIKFTEICNRYEEICKS